MAVAHSVGPHGKAWEKWARAWAAGTSTDQLMHDAGLEAWGPGTPASLAAAYAVWSARAEWRPALARQDADTAERFAAVARAAGSLFGD